MEIAAHREKIERLEDLRQRLDPVEDFELWMWTSMTAATNALNACLHHLGLTPPGKYYPYQIPGLYIEPEPVNGGWRKLFAAPGDVIHIGLPPFEGAIPARVLEAVAALDVIEDLREPYVRGNDPITPELAGRCRDAYDRCMAILRTILAGPRGGTP